MHYTMQKTNWGFPIFSFCDCIFNLNRIFCSGKCLSPSLIVKWQRLYKCLKLTLRFFFPFFFPAMLHLDWKSGITEVKCSFVTDFDRAKVSQPQTHVNGSLTWLQLECSKPDPFVPSQHPPCAGISPPALLLLAPCSTRELSDRSTPELPPCRDVGEDDVLKDEGTARNMSQ